jgi:hypothetical protein
MAKAITAKIATAKVITALEAKLEQVKTNFSNQERLEEDYQKSLKVWQEGLTQFALANISKATNFRTNYRSWNNNLNIDFDIDTKVADFQPEPTRDFPKMANHEYENAVEEITNALNILKMTDEPYVNASTVKSIARYL